MTAPEITIAGRADRGRVIGSLVAAFTNDPVLRHLFADEEAYGEHAPAFFGHLFDKRVDKGTVWTIEHGASVAMWGSSRSRGCLSPSAPQLSAHMAAQRNNHRAFAVTPEQQRRRTVR